MFRFQYSVCPMLNDTDSSLFLLSSDIHIINPNSFILASLSASWSDRQVYSNDFAIYSLKHQVLVSDVFDHLWHEEHILLVTVPLESDAEFVFILVLKLGFLLRRGPPDVCSVKSFVSKCYFLLGSIALGLGHLQDIYQFPVKCLSPPYCYIHLSQDSLDSIV